MDTIPPIRLLFAYNLKKIRQEKNLTQERLAELAHCSPLTITNIENGKSWTKDSTIEKIAAALGVKSDDFFVDSRMKNRLESAVEELTAKITSVYEEIAEKNPETKYNISHVRKK